MSDLPPRQPRKGEAYAIERNDIRSEIILDAPGRFIVELAPTDRRMPFLRVNVRVRRRPEKVFYVPVTQRTSYVLESSEEGLVLQFDSRDIVASSIRPLKISDLVAVLRHRRRQKRFELPLGPGVVLRPLLYIGGPEERELATALGSLAGWGFGVASDNLQKTLSRHFDGRPAQASERRPTAEPKIAVVVHLHYIDLWPEFEALLEAIDRPFHLILTLTQPDKAFAERVRARSKDAEIIVYDNRGRDIGPFMQLLREGRLDPFDLICKLHGKKSGLSGPRMILGDIWRQACAFDLIGSRDVVDRIIAKFGRSPDTLMVGSSRFRLPNAWKDDEAAWGENKAMILNLLEAMGLASGSPPNFFAGTMFWVRRGALEPLKQLDLPLTSFPNEAGQQDGTLQHALERVLGMICGNISGVAWDEVEPDAREADPIE
ncbi:MAG: rhamnan synthesis F [Mesorhizobium sp.]|uniref:rhamnan synthesis F family protein n=1 Tax=Mesorhizobium sp. TaxID=1871066 RepID=UPI001AC1BD0A|nr:rhamnan synthesis F family protein [Mesorhizobium sp.]MBN9219482.1 rhamnan synthesis F [Mesorhizobium sp.]